MQEVSQEIQRQWSELVSSGDCRRYCDARVNPARLSTNKYASQSDHTQTMMRLISNQSILEIGVRQVTLCEGDHTPVARSYDLLLGVVLRGLQRTATVLFDIECRPVSQVDLCVEEPRFALHGTNVIPLVCMPFQAVHVGLRGEPATVDLIYASLDNIQRKALARGSWSFCLGNDVWLHVDNGFATIDECNEGPRFTAVASLCDHSWKHALERQKARTKIFEEELVAKAWHPSRFMKWCLDMTDRASFVSAE